MAQTVKSLPAMRETQVRFLGWEDPLEKEMAAHPSILAWKISRTEGLAGYSPWGRKESDTTEQLHFLFFLSWAGKCHIMEVNPEEVNPGVNRIDLRQLRSVLWDVLTQVGTGEVLTETFHWYLRLPCRGTCRGPSEREKVKSAHQPFPWSGESRERYMGRDKGATTCCEAVPSGTSWRIRGEGSPGHIITQESLERMLEVCLEK